ncbi:hypothetical protein CAPTEDRAFT_204834 [Capitella teleta]|uniref:Uncharacterized protein n=1 Tax=Capitella teleta TaxID=283909 RepID=R7U535_CAPTE|nr:hypothetical protein CAPTEDRAFT_204834 [Capitella teleta]|eukprot:ELU01241.1 hypothetical protein CAPTEDRAFT_204834 [Capitella teleta]
MGTSQVKENHCEALELKNAVYQVIRNGVYHALPEKDWCSRDRPAFKQSGPNQNYMYYIDIGDGWRGWMIGSRLCQNLGGVAAAGNAMTPDEVPRGGWEEVFRGDWHYSQDMIAVCKQ